MSGAASRARLRTPRDKGRAAPPSALQAAPPQAALHPSAAVSAAAHPPAALPESVGTSARGVRGRGGEADARTARGPSRLEVGPPS